jgi:hypothetical protein
MDQSIPTEIERRAPFVLEAYPLGIIFYLARDPIYLLRRIRRFRKRDSQWPFTIGLPLWRCSFKGCQRGWIGARVRSEPEQRSAPDLSNSQFERLDA